MNSKVKPRIKRVFKFLQELNRIKTPPVIRLEQRDWLLNWDAMPFHECIQRGSNPLEETLLKVIRPHQKECPEPSVVIQNWLKPGWDKIGGELVEMRKQSQTSSGKTEQFADSEARQEAWEAWTHERQAWESKEKEVLGALKAFNQLYDLYGRFQRQAEKYQLFIGDGTLVMKTSEGMVHHPILLQRVTLRFNPAVPEFELCNSNDPPELNLRLLRFAGVQGKNIQWAEEKLASGDLHPLEREKTSTFLKELAQQFWKDGKYFDSPLEVGSETCPYIVRNPHFFLGNRNQGFEENVTRYIESLEHQRQLPDSLTRIVGIDPEKTDSSEQNGELLLTNHANPEQERVIRQLEETGAVLVQGPPGTGKSHTIANLIGHLLANDQSILVVSHSSKALRVVREKVATPLQALCVSVLQSDEEGNKELEESVSGIINYLGSTSQKKLEKEIEKITEKRDELKARQDELKGNLRKTIAMEYADVELLGESMTPAQAARELVENPESWLPGPVSGEPPINKEEVETLYKTHQTLSLEDEALLGGKLPDTSSIPSPEDFAKCFDNITQLEKEKSEVGGEFWTSENQQAGSLKKLHELLKDAFTVFKDPSPWIKACAEAGRNLTEGGNWSELATLIETSITEVEKRASLILKHGPKIKSDKSLEDQLRIARAITQQLSKGKSWTKLSGLMHPEWSEFQKSVQLDSGSPKTHTHFTAVVAFLETKEIRETLTKRWDRQLEGWEVPLGDSLGKKPEQKLKSYASQIRKALDWYPKVWAPCEIAMQEQGFAWERVYKRFAPVEKELGDIDRMMTVVQKELNLLFERRLSHLNKMDFKGQALKWMEYLSSLDRKDPAHELVKSLMKGIKKQDYDRYAEAYGHLQRLMELRETYDRYNELLNRLETQAPNWAKQIRKRTSPHNEAKVPGDFIRAWRCRLWESILEESSKKELDRMHEQLASVTEKLHQATATFVEKRAWLAQLKRTGLKQQQALSGWLGLHKKIGKGTGKFVGRLKEEAKKTLKLCRDAVPVWIMPMSRVVESFDLATTNFDVVIVDEASQSDVLGLVAFALGKKVVVVGDHEQVSPYGVGQKGEEINTLIDEMLTDIPNKQLYDGRTSIYDLARQSFGGTIRLVEHFRCAPDIIGFSNQLCYGGEILPLREAASSPYTPHTVAHKVNGKEDKGVNAKEALEIVSLISAICRLEEYEKATIGVICMVGTDQALYIDSVLRKRLSASEYKRRRILCGNASQFQGDERDIVFLSLVHASTGSTLRIRAREDAKKVFNVAASRARDQLWVVHSLNPGADLKAGDLRLQLIQHAERPPSTTQKKKSSGKPNFELALEKAIFEHLDGLGYEVIPNYEIGPFPVGLVVRSENGNRVVVRCDGEGTMSESALSESLARQMTLERLGWEFIRVRASEYHLDPEKIQKSVVRQLKRLDISPRRVTPDPNANPNELLERVIKRAELIRNRWKDIPTASAVKKASTQTKKAS